MSKLFLIPTTLAKEINHNVLLPFQNQMIKHLQHFIVETPKIARLHLKALQLTTAIQQLEILELNKHKQDINTLLQPLRNGFDVGLISDCGTPAIADPGCQLIKAAHYHGIKVVPLIGPSSIFLALMASGVNGQSFAFNGYIPIDNKERIERLKNLQDLVIKNNQTQIIIEAPFRNQFLFETIINNLLDNINLSLAIDLMCENEEIISQTIHNWCKLKTLPNLYKREVIFILGN